jgi:hypothetical protein
MRLGLSEGGVRFFGCGQNNNINAPRGAVIYTNADTQKLEILRENKNKRGIYR